MKILRKAIEYYKDLKIQEKQKKMLLEKTANFGLLEQLVQRVNDNPNLKINVHLNDGTILELKTYYKNSTSTVNGIINGVENIE